MTMQRTSLLLVAAALFPDGGISPRSEGWGSYEVLLNHPVVRSEFERLGFDPDSTSHQATFFDLGNALFYAHLRARDDEEAWFRRANELIVWMTLRADCHHRRWGLPDTLDAAAMRDLDAIARLLRPPFVGLEYPPCKGGASK